MAAVAPPQIRVNDAPVLPGLQSSFSNMSMKEEHASQDARATPAAMASEGNTHAQPSNSSNNQDQNGNGDGKNNNNQQQNVNNGGEASGQQENGRGGPGRGRGYRGGRRRGGRGRGAGPSAGDRQQNGQDNGQGNGETDAEGADWAAAAEDGIRNNGQQGNGRRRNQGRNANNNNNKTDTNNRGQGAQQNRVQAPGPRDRVRTSWNTVVYKSRIFTSPTHMYEPDQLRMGNRTWSPKNGGFAPPEPQRGNPNKKRDFWICGFNAGTTAKEITDRLAERGIVDINYLRVLPPQSNAWWKSIRLSVQQKDVDTLLDANTWEPWICVVPWNWDQEGQPGLGPRRGYGNYGYDDGSYDNGNYQEGNYNNGPGQRRRMSAGQPLP